MLKFIGALFFSAACLLCGTVSSRGTNEKFSQENAFLSLIFHIKTMIAASGTPISVILRGYSCKALEKNGVLQLMQKASEPFTVFKNHKDKLYLDSFETETMTAFFCEIGKCPCVSESLHLCDKYSELMKAHINETRNGEKKKAELSKKLSFVAAAAVFVIFI